MHGTKIQETKLEIIRINVKFLNWREFELLSSRNKEKNFVLKMVLINFIIENIGIKKT